MNKKTEIRDLLDYSYPENLMYSPDGTYLAFQRAVPDEEKNSYRRDVWMIKDGQVRQFTSACNTSAVFWDDSTHLAVTREVPDEKPGITQLYRIDVTGGEAQEWIRLPFPLTDMKKVGDGVYAVLGMIDKNDPDAYKDKEDVRAKKAEDRKKEADYQVVDEIPYWFNGAGYINGKRTALFIVRTGEKTAVKRITAPLFDTQEMIVDGTRIIYVGNTKGRAASLYTKVYAYDTETGKRQTVYGRSGYMIHSPVMIGGQLYVQATDMKEYGGNETACICRVTENGLEKVFKPERSLYAMIAGDTMLGGGKSKAVYSDELYTLATVEDHISIWKYDRNWNKTVLLDEAGGIFFLDVSDRGVAFARETADSLGEVWEMDHDGKNLRKLTDLNSKALEGKYVALPQRIDYTSGTEQLHGWVLLPDGFDPKKKYPAVLDIHGGPRAVYGEIFFHEMQVWAAKGYVVLFTNIRGSDGRGDAFADIRGILGTVDFDNLMDFTDAVLKAYPNIDPGRLCETGGSYGGFMTNWIITHTDRFCCAVSQRSIANWVSMTFIGDIGPIFTPDQCGTGTPFGDESTERMWKQSPLRYADKVKTPTLFIHSDEDYRCPLAEGMQMMQALAARNIDTRMVIFKGENHELSRAGKPLHRIRRLEEITGWFDRYAKGEKK